MVIQVYFHVILLLRVHNPADRCKVHSEVISNLTLAVAILLDRFVYRRISFFLIADRFLIKQLLKGRPVGIPLAPGNLRDVFVFLEMIHEMVDKVLFPQK